MGITPAYAGNTKCTMLKGQKSRDHPRLRGEHYRSLSDRNKLEGSPPPTRGTLFTVCYLLRSIGSPPPTRGTLTPYGKSFYNGRITPAYAGNTTRRPLRLFNYKDHPRLRGEHDTFFQIRKTIQGSPPPTRGTQAHFVHICRTVGITPAYAGNTH